MKIKSSSLFALFLLAVVLIFIIMALKFPFQAAIGPIAVGVPAAILLLVQIGLEISGKSVTRKKKRIENQTEEEKTSAGKKEMQGYLVLLAWTVGLLVSAYLFGIMIIFPVFTLAYIKTHNFGWITAIGTAAGMFVVLYVGFNLLLGIKLYAGLIFELF